MTMMTTTFKGGARGVVVIPMAALLGLMGCVLGDGDDEVDSPYDGAAISDPVPGVADGVSTVAVEVTGRVGARLTLEVSGGATFEQSDADKPTEKTVYLEDTGDGTGAGSAAVKTTKPGPVKVFFKVDPLFEPELIEFLPVRMLAGPAKPVEYQPGLLVHEACLAVNSKHGTLTSAAPPEDPPEDEFKSAEDFSVEVSDQAPAGLTCPSTAVDAIGWVGFAKISYASASGDDEVDLSYLGPEAAVLVSTVVELAGSEFPGYEVTGAAPSPSESFVAVTLAVDYKPVGDLVGGLAKAVTLEQRFVPEPGPGLLGSSSGGPEDPIVTGNDGKVTLFFALDAPGTYAWFVTPQGGAPTQLELVIEEPIIE